MVKGTDNVVTKALKLPVDQLMKLWQINTKFGT
jgi:hypothetical protein